MTCTNNVINPLDYEALAWSHANKSNKRFLKGSSLEDIKQSAMLGICEAAKNYDCSKGKKFEVYAFWYIRRAINLLFYKSTQVDGKPTLVAIADEALYGDLPETDEFNYEDCQLMAAADNKEGDLFVQEFMEELPLEGVEKQYFVDMVTEGPLFASKAYRETTGNSIQRAAQIKNKVKSIAADYYERCV